MRRLLLNNLGWKLLSLAIAVVLWYAVVGEPLYEASVSAPLLLTGAPADLEISSERPERVSLELQGPSSLLDQEHLSSVAVVLDLSSVSQPGERTFTLSRENVRLPRGLTLRRAVPSQIRLYFERRITATIPVRARFANDGFGGYFLRRQEISPGKLRVVGPESHVRRAAWAETDLIDLAGVTGERVFRVNVFLDDPQVRFEDAPQVDVLVETAKTWVVGDR